MTESSEKIEDVYEQFNSQADRINYLIKEFIELKETINECRKNRHYWRLHLSTLSINIWTKQVKYLELQKKEANLRNAISAIRKVIELKSQELKDLIVKRKTYFSEQCDKFRIKGIEYTNNFLCAQKQYSNENLTKDIREFQTEYQNIYNELPTLMQKLINLETLCGLNNLNYDGKPEEVSKINLTLTGIIENNNDISLKIISAEDMLGKLENEIKQKKIILNTFYNK